MARPTPFTPTPDPRGAVPSRRARRDPRAGRLRAIALGGLLQLGGCALSPAPDGLAALTAAAEAGDVAEQLALARAYEEGTLVPADPARALRWYREAADGGSVPGAYRAAELLLGSDDDADRDEARTLLERASRGGSPRASARLAALIARESPEDSRALQRAFALYLDAAEAGSVEAQYEVGAMLALGRGTGRDYPTASRWFRAAAERGDPRAQTALGDLHVAGLGVPGDITEALAWYRRAAEQGAFLAQSHLGDLLTLERYGSSTDVEAGMRWYRLAAEQGHVHAQSRLGQLLADGPGRDVAEAARWLRAAADRGYAPAQCHLGNLYRRGAGVPQDLDAAERWYARAAAQSPAGVVPLLGFVYYDCRRFASDGPGEDVVDG